MTPLVLIYGIGGVLVAGIALAQIMAWAMAAFRRKTLQDTHTVTAEYQAPVRLSAAELGYIVDGQFGSNELLATISQLYGKGMVSLTPVSSDDFILTATDAHGSVDDGESSVLGYLRSLPDATTTWKRFDSLVSDTVGPQADFEDSVVQTLVSKGLLGASPLSGMLWGGGLVAKLIASLTTVAALAMAYSWQYTHTAAGSTSAAYSSLDNGISHFIFLILAVPCWLLAYIYVNLLTYIYNRREGTPLRATAALTHIWSDVAGFQLFLQETEYVRLQHDRNPRDPSMAYCLALGLDPGFIQSLKS